MVSARREPFKNVSNQGNIKKNEVRRNLNNLKKTQSISPDGDFETNETTKKYLDLQKCKISENLEKVSNEENLFTIHDRNSKIYNLRDFTIKTTKCDSPFLYVLINSSVSSTILNTIRKVIASKKYDTIYVVMEKERAEELFGFANSDNFDKKPLKTEQSSSKNKILSPEKINLPNLFQCLYSIPGYRTSFLNRDRGAVTCLYLVSRCGDL